MLQEYARLHVLLCLIPALFIAGAGSVFISHDSVMKFLGAKAKKWLAIPWPLFQERFCCLFLYHLTSI